MSTLHGVMLEIHDTGVLILGDSGTGKSELALTLLFQGAKLIADDAPQFELDSDGQLIASAADNLRGMLAIRDVGIIKIERHFGPEAIADCAPVDIAIELTRDAPQEITTLQPRHTQILEQQIPLYRLATGTNRDLALLTHTLIQQHLLLLEGLDSTGEWLSSQQPEING